MRFQRDPFNGFMTHVVMLTELLSLKAPRSFPTFFRGRMITIPQVCFEASTAKLHLKASLLDREPNVVRKTSCVMLCAEHRSISSAV